MTKKLPQTSIDAMKSVTPEMLNGHYKKIIDSLSVLGTANYEKISQHNGLEPHATARRMKELQGLGLVYCPGTKSKTKSNRDAMDYCLTGKGFPKTDNETRNLYQKGEKSAAEHSVELIKECKQIKLF